MFKIYYLVINMKKLPNLLVICKSLIGKEEVNFIINLFINKF